MSISMQELRRGLPLKIATSPDWAPLVLQNINGFLIDHVSCERKAHTAALMLVHKFPEYPELQDRMIQLAREELDHFQQVVRILRQRGLAIGHDEIDPYVKQLLAHVRHPRDQHLLDRLMVAALIEARSCERFCLFAEALPAGDLKNFYESFAREESAHFPLFVSTAKLYYSATLVDQTLENMLDTEAKILPAIPLRATVH